LKSDGQKLSGEFDFYLYERSSLLTSAIIVLLKVYTQT